MTNKAVTCELLARQIEGFPNSYSGRISISLGPSMGLGQRFTHAVAFTNTITRIVCLLSLSRSHRPYIETTNGVCGNRHRHEIFSMMKNSGESANGIRARFSKPLPHIARVESGRK